MMIKILLLRLEQVLAVKKQPGEKSMSLRWLLLALGAFFCTGGIGVMQKLHQSTVYKGELNEFLVIAFGVSAVLSGLYLLLMPKSKKVSNSAMTSKLRWFILAILVGSGVTTAFCNQWNLYLSGVMDSAVFFPLVNGGGLVLTTLAAVLVFKERLSKQQWIGIGVGIASVLCLCLQF